jgi:hypothetical protein
MLAIADDPARGRALGLAARERALARFPEVRCTDRTEQLYVDLLDRRFGRAA